MPAPLRAALRLPLAIGDAAIHRWRQVAYLVAIAAAVALVACRPHHWTRTVRTEVVEQCYVVGARAVVFVLLLAVLAGAALVGQTLSWLTVAGQTELVGRFVVFAIVRETAPLTVALIVMGRSGTAIVAELGTMKASGQVRALDAQGINPFLYLVVPRVLAVTLATFCLTVLFIWTALTSGYGLALAFDLTTMAPSFFIDLVLKSLGSAEGIGLPLKTLLPGVMMGAICCARGLEVSQSVTEIPRAITRGFVHGVTATALINLVASVLIYF